MAVPRIGGAGIGLPTFPGLAAQTTGPNAGTIAGATNSLSLTAGETWLIPAGTWMVYPGPYTFVQELDPVTNVYRTRPTAATVNQFVESDGANWRLANTTGCVVGAVITTATCTGSTNGIGSAINGVTCTASSGGSVWTTIIGGAISATIATATASNTTAGSGYTYPPIVIIDAPPQGGLQATAFCSLSGGSTVTAASITVVNQGAGYTSAPNITFVNDPRDTTGAGAFYVTTLTATGQLTGLYPINHGTALTGVPALTFGIGSCAATAIMNFTVTSYATGTVGSSIANANITTNTNLIAAQASPAVVNPMHAGGITFPRPARITAGISAGTVVTTGQIVEDGGLGIQGVPNAIMTYTITSTTAAVPFVGALAVGGITDTSFIQPI